MKTKNLATSIMISIMLVIASLLLILLRVVLILLAWPPYKLLEKTNRAYSTVMVEVYSLLTL